MKHSYLLSLLFYTVPLTCFAEEVEEDLAFFEEETGETQTFEEAFVVEEQDGTMEDSMVAEDAMQDAFVVEEQEEAESLIDPAVAFEDTNQMIGNAETPSATPWAPAKSARPLHSQKWGAVLYGDLLYWKAAEQGLSYALQSPNFTSFPPFAQNDLTKGVKGEISRLKSDYQLGYRLGATLLLPYDGWDVEGIWTSYHASHHNSVSQRPNQVVFAFWLNQNFSPTALSATAHWDLHFNTLDVAVGRAFFAGRALSLRPFFGFRAAWIEQDLHFTYRQITFSDGTTEAWIRSHHRNNFQGYGLLAGFNGKWDLGWGFALLGNFAASLLWSDFDLAQFEKNANHTPRSHLKQDKQILTPQLQLLGGASWEVSFYRDRLYLQCYAGWEEQLWFDQNQLNRFLDNINIGLTYFEKGDLSFSGLTAGIKFGF